MARRSWFSRRGTGVVGAVVAMFWAAAITLTAVSTLPAERKDGMLATQIVGALVFVANFVYRYRQVSRRERGVVG